MHRLIVFCVLAAVAAAGCLASSAAAAPPHWARIQHLVVIFEENHSFDALYGGWEGVNGLANADPAHTQQIKQDGTPYACLLQDDVNLAAQPARCSDSANGSSYSSHFFNEPFTIDDYIPPSATTCPPISAPSQPNGWLAGTGLPGGCTRDLVHSFYQEQYQLNGGRQNRYVTGSDAAGLTMGHYDTQRLPVYRYLHAPGHPHYAILDNFFQAAHGGSFLNHQWLIAAATPVFPGAAAELHSVLDPNGMPVLRSPPAAQSPVALYLSPSSGLADTALAAVCPAPLGLACGDYVVNTAQSPSQPHKSTGTQMPLQTAPTIGDRLSAAGVDWAWYSGGWSNAAGLVGAPGWTNGNGPSCADPDSFPNPAFPYCPNFIFQFHHQPFNYFANFAEGAPGRSHLRDEVEFSNVVAASDKACGLKPVSFVKPAGQENEHPGYASTTVGSEHLVSLLRAIDESRCRKDTMVIVTYDEFGGAWDHVSPPGQGGAPGVHDRWGPGTRIPALVMSPLLRGNFAVDHTQYDTTSIAATIERFLGLPPLSSRDAAVNDLSAVFTARRP